MCSTALKGLDLQTGVFTFQQIKAATDNFAAANKIGEGGFGPVFKVNSNIYLTGTHTAILNIDIYLLLPSPLL